MANRHSLKDKCVLVDADATPPELPWLVNEQESGERLKITSDVTPSFLKLQWCVFSCASQKGSTAGGVYGRHCG